MNKLILKGSIPQPSVILCRDEDARLLIMHTLHEDWAQRPTVHVMEEWPEAWANINAAVITPLLVLGAEQATSFSIVGDEEVSEEERKILNAYISVMRSGTIGRATYRDLVAATGMDRRTIQKHVKALASKGIGTYRFREGFTLDIGRWMPDAAKAKAFGIEIKEY